MGEGLQLDRLEALMAERGYGPGELAYHSGLSYDYVWKIRKGGAPNIAAVQVQKLAVALKTSADYLLGLSNDRTVTAESGGEIWPADVVTIAERLGDLPDETRQRAVNAVAGLLDAIEAELYAGLSAKKRQIVDYFDDLGEADQEYVLNQVLALLQHADDDAPTHGQQATK